MDIEKVISIQKKKLNSFNNLIQHCVEEKREIPENLLKAKESTESKKLICKA